MNHQLIAGLIPYLLPSVAKKLVMKQYEKEDMVEGKFYLIGYFVSLVGTEITCEDIAEVLAYIRGSFDKNSDSYGRGLHGDDLIIAINILRRINDTEALAMADDRVRDGFSDCTDISAEFWEAEALGAIDDTEEFHFKLACGTMIDQGIYPDDVWSDDFENIIGYMDKYPSLVELRNQYLKQCKEWYVSNNNVYMLAYAQHFLGEKEQADANFMASMNAFVDQLNFHMAADCAEMLGQTDLAEKLQLLDKESRG